MEKLHRRQSGWTFDSINYFILTVFLVITIYPFYYVFIYSISGSVLAQGGVTFWPKGFSLESYRRIFQLKGIYNATVVSVSRTVSGTLLTVICSSFFAYVITKKELLFRKFVYRFTIITMYFNAGFIPWYLTMKAYGLNNTFWLYIIPSAVDAYFIILIKTFMEQMGTSLEESAKIDGAGYLKIFISIMLPLCKPIIATISVFAAVSQWNTWTDNYFLVEDFRLKTLQLLLYEYLNQANAIATMSSEDLIRSMKTIEITPRSIKMTMTMVVTLPIIFVYPFAQRYFVKGIMLGAIKG